MKFIYSAILTASPLAFLLLYKFNQNKMHKLRILGESRLGDWVKKVKGLRRTTWCLYSSHRHVKYNIGNIVNNTLITMYGVRWY